MATTLFYIHDPMCSWCYAFDSSFTALQKELPDFIGIKKIAGGLAPDTTLPMPVELQQKIQQTWRQIEQTVPTIRFNYDFWIINTPVRSTYPACRAVLAARRQGPGFEDKMIGAIQTAYYQKAKNPSLESTLLECALAVGLDADRFADDLTSHEIEEELQNEIRTARKMGVISYPTLLLEHDGRLFPIAVDYLDHETMTKIIVRILEKPSTTEELDEIEKVTLSHYDQNAEAFWNGTKDHDVTQNYEAFLAPFPTDKKLDILDLGCGPGRDVNYFKSLGHRPVGLDGSEVFCRMAREYTGCRILHQKFLSLELPRHAFDGIFANASLFHVPSRQLPRVLRDIHAALRPGGILFLSNPRGHGEGWSGQRYGHYMQVDTSKLFLEEAGFEIADYYYRPPGKPIHEQPWLAIVAMKVALEST